MVLQFFEIMIIQKLLNIVWNEALKKAVHYRSGRPCPSFILRGYHPLLITAFLFYQNIPYFEVGLIFDQSAERSCFAVPIFH